MSFPLVSWVWRLTDLCGWLWRMLSLQLRNRLILLSSWWRGSSSSSKAILPAPKAVMDCDSQHEAEEGLVGQDDADGKIPPTEAHPTDAVSISLEESVSVPVVAEATEPKVPFSMVPMAASVTDIVNDQGGKRRYHTDAQQKGNKKRKEVVRPNHFIAFRVSNEEVWNNVQQFQERMISRACEGLKKPENQAKLFKETLISAQKLHFTLHVMALESEDHKELATQTLDAVYQQIKEDFTKNPIQFPITGLGHFRNNVLFAKICGDEHIARLEKLAALIREEFEKVGLVGDSKSFQPHMTVAKMSKAKRLQKRKVKAFPIEVWNEDENMHFGHQTIHSIELLSMQDTDPTTKYYKALARFSFPLGNENNFVSETN